MRTYYEYHHHRHRPHSPAERAGVQVGEQLLSINGHPIVDVLDYRFYGYDPLSHLELKTAAGNVRHVTCRKAEGQDLGLNFDTYLMDEMRSCANHCLFCFVDQMPPGMRSTLYFKDDDARLSFLLGNYITLTNLTEREAQRIIDLHISPHQRLRPRHRPTAALHHAWQQERRPVAGLYPGLLQGRYRHERADRGLPRLERR